MRRFAIVTLSLLFIISVCINVSVTAEWKSAGGAGKRNKQTYGYVYISKNPYSYWDDDGTRVMTLTDHSFDVYNFSDRSCSYEYEYKQWLSEYDPVRGVAGINISENKGFGHGSLAAYDAENHNWPDYHAVDSAFQHHYLPDFDLEDEEWYEVGGYTRLVVLGRKGTDSWQVNSENMHFKWVEPAN